MFFEVVFIILKINSEEAAFYCGFQLPAVGVGFCHDDHHVLRCPSATGSGLSSAWEPAAGSYVLAKTENDVHPAVASHAAADNATQPSNVLFPAQPYVLVKLYDGGFWCTIHDAFVAMYFPNGFGCGGAGGGGGPGTGPRPTCMCTYRKEKKSRRSSLPTAEGEGEEGGARERARVGLPQSRLRGRGNQINIRVPSSQPNAGCVLCVVCFGFGGWSFF